MVQILETPKCITAPSVEINAKEVLYSQTGENTTDPGNALRRGANTTTLASHPRGSATNISTTNSQLRVSSVYVRF
jgi:hypothetical protein